MDVVEQVGWGGWKGAGVGVKMGIQGYRFQGKGSGGAGRVESRGLGLQARLFRVREGRGNTGGAHPCQTESPGTCRRGAMAACGISHVGMARAQHARAQIHTHAHARPHPHIHTHVQVDIPAPANNEAAAEVLKKVCACGRLTSVITLGRVSSAA